MAALLTIRCETDAVMDDVRRLVGVHAALARRHGAPFRALDRDIEQMLEGDMLATSTWAELPDTDGLLLMLLTPPEISALLARAVALGVAPDPF